MCTVDMHMHRKILNRPKRLDDDRHLVSRQIHPNVDGLRPILRCDSSLQVRAVVDSFVCHGLHAGTPLKSRRQGARCFVLDLLRLRSTVGNGLERVNERQHCGERNERQ